MSWLDRQVLSLTWNSMQERFELPKVIEGRGHLVIDFDDATVCAHLQAEGVSLLHLVYLGRTGSLISDSPRPISLEGFNPFSATDLGRLAKGLYNSSWQLPPSRGWSCWSGDTGPRTRFDERLLNREGVIDASFP